MATSAMNAWLIAFVRVGVALMWIQNVNWKNPPTFGQSGSGGLYKWTNFAIEHQVFAPYAWIVENFVLPNFLVFAWGVLIVEACLGGFLLVGLATRFWAVIGVGQTLAITLSVLNAPHEWHWAYFLMLLVHIALFATAAGRHFGVDGVLASPALMRKAAVALGGASIVSAVFYFVDGEFGFIDIGGGALIVALAVGALACLAGVLGRPIPIALTGLAFLVAAIAQISFETVDNNVLGGDGSTFSFWLGLGAGLLAVAVAGHRSTATKG